VYKPVRNFRRSRGTVRPILVRIARANRFAARIANQLEVREQPVDKPNLPAIDSLAHARPSAAESDPDLATGKEHSGLAGPTTSLPENGSILLPPAPNVRVISEKPGEPVSVGLWTCTGRMDRERYNVGSGGRDGPAVPGTD
jgi:hypothetical protein